MAAKGAKKGKKGKTMALTDFLSDDTGNVQGPAASYGRIPKAVDWATEMDDADINSDLTYGQPIIDRTKLPTAPKASRGPDDISKVPTEPPFTAFIGNLPYDASEEKIMDFFKKLPVANVRLPDDGGRLRGFGYVQFETRDALINALSMSEESFGGRKVRIDLAGESQHGGDNRKGGRSRDDGQQDRTEGNWRGSDGRTEPSFNDRGSNKYDDRGHNQYEDRGSSNRYDDRGGHRDGGGFDERRGGRYGDGERRAGYSGRMDDKGGYGRDHRDERGSGGGFNDVEDGGGRRAFGSSFHREEQDTETGGAWERGQGFSGDRGGGRKYERGGCRGSDRGYDRGGDKGYDKASDRGFDRGGSKGNETEDRYSRQEATNVTELRERPRLNLQPRSKPAENIVEDRVVDEKPKQSIFGSAKPVDTAHREREIEDRLMKQKLEPVKTSSLESRGYTSAKGFEDSKELRDKQRTYENQDNKENRNIHIPEGGSQRRSGSEKSEDGETRKERRSSGSSKTKKGTSSTHSQHSSGDQEATSVGEEHNPQNTAVTPVFREEPTNFVPAPPPKENIWEKRKTTQTMTSPINPEESNTPLEETRTAQQLSPQSICSPKQQQPGRQTSKPPAVTNSESNASKGEVKKEFVPAEPPKENPWTRRKQQIEHQGLLTDSPDHSSGPAQFVTAPSNVANAWTSRGSPSAGRGLGGRGNVGVGRGDIRPPQKIEKKEKPLPQSIDEMPKLEQKNKKDFSDDNKFSYLIDDDGGDFEEVEEA